MIENKIKCVACYVRVSTDEQVKYGFSIQAQIDALTAYCKANNYRFVLFIDEGISASSMKRPALQAMLSRVIEFDMILFTKLDRLSRNVLDANTINKILKDNNCVMKAIDEDDIDTSTADGTFIFNLKVSLAQREIGKTSERINFVFKNKREKGEVTSGQRKYGYDIIDKHFVVNEEEADKIRNLYKYFISVNGEMQRVYEYFVIEFPGKGYNALRLYLRDTAYIGKYKLYRKDEYVDNYIPAILDESLFYEVQSLLKKYSKSTITKKTGLFDGILYCSNCQNKLSRRVDSRTKCLTVRYICWNSSKLKVGIAERCCKNNKNIRENYIEQYLLDNIKKEAENYIIKNKEVKNDIKIIDNSIEINRLNKKLEKLKDLYLDDLIDKDLYNKDYQKYKLQIELLKSQQIVTSEKKDLSNVEKLITLDFEIYHKLSRDNKRKFWLSIIDKIYINDGKIQEIIFL